VVRERRSGAGAAHLSYLEASALEPLLMLASPASEMAGERGGRGVAATGESL